MEGRVQGVPAPGRALLLGRVVGEMVRMFKKRNPGAPSQWSCRSTPRDVAQPAPSFIKTNQIQGAGQPDRPITFSHTWSNRSFKLQYNSSNESGGAVRLMGSKACPWPGLRRILERGKTKLDLSIRDLTKAGSRTVPGVGRCALSAGRCL